MASSSSIINLGLTKHNIFLSHTGAQKDFVEQLCVDLEAQGYSPFFDQRLNSLPKGKEFAPLILQAAQHCRVAVIVLSQEYLLSKWPMIELEMFHAAQAGNPQLNVLPLFFKLSVHDLDDQAIKERWMSKWIQHASEDKRIHVAKWCAAVRALRKVNGIVFGKHSTTEVAYRKEIVQSISILLPPDLVVDGSSKNVASYDRMCQPSVERLRVDPLASKLLSLSMKTRRDKRCKVNVEVAELTGSRRGPFHPLLGMASKPDAGRGSMKKASAGGYEVKNDTSVRLTIEVTWQDTWFFYVITRDESIKGSKPELVYPLIMLDDDEAENCLSHRSGARVFPCRQQYEDDPVSLKIQRSSKAPADACDPVSLYLVVVKSCLTPDHKPNQEITIEDVSKFLNVTEEPGSNSIIVKHYQFDIRPTTQRKKNTYRPATSGLAGSKHNTPHPTPPKDPTRPRTENNPQARRSKEP